MPAPALIKRLLLVKYTETSVKFAGKAEHEKAVIAEHFYYQEEHKYIFTKGCIDFTLFNIGTAKAYLWDNIVILPGQTFTLPKSTPLPLANDIPIKYEGDYTLTRNVADISSVIGTIQS
ncbi:MAG: hypothetical protein JST26_04850 [Bacteroidetes bacterium]|nr:hypothetical protein [Bacteroidota bacterium]